MERKWPAVSVINPNSDMPCSALLLPPGSISINTNLLSHTLTQTCWGNNLLHEKTVSLPSSGPNSELLKETWNILLHTRRTLIGFSIPPRVESLKPPLGYWWAGYWNNARVVPYLRWLPRKPDHLSQLLYCFRSHPGYLHAGTLRRVLEKVNGTASAWCKYLTRFLGRN